MPPSNDMTVQNRGTWSPCRGRLRSVNTLSLGVLHTAVLMTAELFPEVVAKVEG
jgi:hypothetical protein